MDFRVSLAFSISSTVTSLLQLYIAVELFLLDQPWLLWVTLALFLASECSLYYFLKYHEHRPQEYSFLVFSIFQLEAVYVLIKKMIPMSVQSYIGYRSFVEYVFLIANGVFLFTLQTYEIENTSDLAVNAYTILLMRIYQFAVFIIIYIRFTMNFNYTLKDCLQAYFIYLAFYLTLGTTSTIHIIGKQFNLGLFVLILILINSLVSLVYNIRQIKDNQNGVSWFDKFVLSIICNSHPYRVCTYGQKKTTIICSFINQLVLFSLLIIQIAVHTISDLQNFSDLSQNKKVMVVNIIIAFFLNCYYVILFSYDFVHQSLSCKSLYVNSDEDLHNVSMDLSQKAYLLSEVDVQFKNNYAPTQNITNSESEQTSLIEEDKCNNSACKLQYEFLLSVSYLLKNKIQVNLNTQTFTLCEMHTKELLSTQECVNLQCIEFNSTIANPQKVIMERFTNGLINTPLTNILIERISENQVPVIRQMFAQAYQIFTFMKTEKELLTVLPNLALFDLYSIDV